MGYIFFCGFSRVNTFPTTAGAYQTTTGSFLTNDAFLVKLSSTGNLLWSTFYGGPGWEYGSAVCTDVLGNVYLGGSTASNNAIHLIFLLSSYHNLA